MTDWPQTCLAEAERRAREHGFEPRKLQLAWRIDPPDYREDGKWMRECTSAILDALNHEGVVAWDGDAISCVAQIVQAYARRAAFTARRANP